MATPIILLCLIIPFLFSCSSTDESIDTPNSSDSQIPIGFDNYVGRNITRGSVNDESTIAKDGFGVFAMLTTGKYGEGSNTNFSGAFMDNVQVTGTAVSSSSSSTAYTWNYNPRRYWPNSNDEYVSFLAYAPFKTPSPLCSLPNSTDSTYINYSLESNKPESTTDWIYNSNNALNQQYYTDETGDDLHTTDYAIMDADGNSTVQNDLDADKNYAVKLKMSHATARLAFAITSSALADSHNFLSTYKEGKESEATITINKFIIGKRSEDKDPAMPRRKFAYTRAVTDGSDMEDAFYSEGYLNLNPTATYCWTNIETTRLVSFAFNGTHNVTENNGVTSSVDDPVTYEGVLNASATSGNKWIPASKTASDNAPVRSTKVIFAKKNDSGNITVNTIGNSASDYMFIIPQNFEGSTTAETTGVTDQESGDGPIVANPKALTCYINYTVTYATNGETTVEKDDDKLKVTYFAYGEIGKNFKAGRAYLILVDIGAGTSFAPIKINVSEANEWGNENSDITQ